MNYATSSLNESVKFRRSSVILLLKQMKVQDVHDPTPVAYKSPHSLTSNLSEPEALFEEEPVFNPKKGKMVGM